MNEDKNVIFSLESLRYKFPWFYKLTIWQQIIISLFLWPVILGMVIWFGFKVKKIRHLGIVLYILMLLSISEVVSYSGTGARIDTVEPQVAGVVESKVKEQDKQKLSSEATSTNDNITFDSDLASQDINNTKQVNSEIASIGTSTKDKKLFDVTSVVDGDTIKVSELGTLRLIGIDTPETKDPRKPVQCFGKEASQRGHDLLDGKKVYLEFDPANRIDKYGRTLAYVYREDGYFYNLEMVKDGYAHSYVQYPHSKLDEFNKAQEEARNNNKGFWGSNTCGGDTQKSAADSSLQGTQSPALEDNSKPDPLPPVKPIPQIKTPTNNSKIEPLPEENLNQPDGFIEGTCAELKSRGLGNWPRGDVNYTSSRDGDNDGIACNLN